MIDARVQANYRSGYWRGIFGPTEALGHIFEENKSGTSVNRCAALVYAMLIDGHRRPCSGFFWVCIVLPSKQQKHALMTILGPLWADNAGNAEIKV